MGSETKHDAEATVIRWAARMLGETAGDDCSALYAGDGDGWEAAIESGLLVRWAGDPHPDCEACADGDCYVYAPGVEQLLRQVRDGR